MPRAAAASLALVLAQVFAFGCGDATPPPAAPTAAAAEPDPPQGDQTSTLDVYCEPPTEILLDGKPIGKSPLQKYKVSPGAHDVTFTDDVSGPRTMSVTVEPGENRSVTSDKPRTSRDATTTPEDPKKKKK